MGNLSARISVFRRRDRSGALAIASNPLQGHGCRQTAQDDHDVLTKTAGQQGGHERADPLALQQTQERQQQQREVPD